MDAQTVLFKRTESVCKKPFQALIKKLQEQGLISPDSDNSDFLYEKLLEAVDVMVDEHMKVAEGEKEIASNIQTPKAKKDAKKAILSVGMDTTLFHIDMDMIVPLYGDDGWKENFDKLKSALKKENIRFTKFTDCFIAIT